MDDTMNFLDALSSDQTTSVIADTLNSIMAMDDNTITPETIALYKNIINAAFTGAVVDKVVNNLMEEWDNLGYNRQQATLVVTNIKNEFAVLVDQLKPSDGKRALLNTTIESLTNIFDATLEKYHNYAFELPIKIEGNGQIPTYAHDSDAAADLYASETITLEPHSLGNKVATDIKIALPEGWMACVVPRSSIGAKTPLRLSNSIGIIDSSYRGLLGILYDNISDSPYTINVGDRIAQLLIFPAYHFKPQQVDILPVSDRGEGGFGSTGK